MKWITIITRLLLGFVFLGSGIAFFLSTPPPMEGPIADFFKGMVADQIFFYLLKGTEIGCGALLMAGRYVPLALVILAPVVLNIFLVHAFMMPQGLPLAIDFAALRLIRSFQKNIVRRFACSSNRAKVSFARRLVFAASAYLRF